MKIGRILGFFAVIGAMLSTPAMAQSEQAIVLSGDVKLIKTIVEEDGEKRTELADTSVVVPGDELLFRTDYRNQSQEPVENFVLTNPLSPAVAFSAANDPDQQVSVDGGQNWGLLSELTITAEDGTTRAATGSDVTHLRWVLQLIEPGQTGQITFNAIVR